MCMLTRPASCSKLQLYFRSSSYPEAGQQGRAEPSLGSSGGHLALPPPHSGHPPTTAFQANWLCHFCRPRTVSLLTAATAREERRAQSKTSGPKGSVSRVHHHHFTATAGAAVEENQARGQRPPSFKPTSQGLLKPASSTVSTNFRFCQIPWYKTKNLTYMYRYM